MTASSKTNMNVYELLEPDNVRSQPDWVDGMVDFEQVVCPLVPGHRSAGYRSFPLVIEVSRRGLADLMWIGNDLVVSDAVVNCLKDEGITGWDTAPVRVRVKKDGWLEGGYHELVVTGWGGIAPEESGLRLIERCEGCGSEDYTGWTDPSSLFDPSQWDGSDFFTIYPLVGYRFVTQRVVDSLEKNKFKHVKFIQLIDVISMHYGCSLKRWAATPREACLAEARVRLGFPPPPGRPVVPTKKD